MGSAQEVIPPPAASYSGGFAIVIDKDSYAACKPEVDAYRNLLLREGLGAYILSDNWSAPEPISEALKVLYKEAQLEGAVFIGQIPIPMVRDAQHMASAFKMDQERWPWREASIPSDRFYDDFDLKFDFLSRDTSNALFFYYSLRPDSPQRIHCDIYSGRIKPTAPGARGHAQISNYLRKVLAERAIANPLDVLCSYTGEGSYSNSLSAWKDERICLREQIPAAFTSAASAKFFLFYMESHTKETVSNQLRRPELDLMLFHGHGLPDYQYLTGTPIATDIDEYVEGAQRDMREQVRRAVSRNAKLQELEQSFIQRYGVDSSWWAGAFSPELQQADSIETALRTIYLDDIAQIAPNPRFVIFDACYNGDFREDRYIAGEYIFAPGRTIAGFGNSVNVLQDKSAGDLLGLLGLGLRVGEWAQQVNIIESHITGDPTFRFSPAPGSPQIALKESRPEYWIGFLNKEQPADLQALALLKLSRLHAPDMARILHDTYMQSPYYMVRLQCLHLLPQYGGTYYHEVLKKAVTDPYEFIRRLAVYSMGRVGLPEFQDYVKEVALYDALSERVAFNVDYATQMLGMKGPDFFGYRIIEDIFDPAKSLSTRTMGVSYLRNNPNTLYVDRLLALLQDGTAPLELRLPLAEALGWYDKSHRKADILAVCEKLSAERGQPELAAAVLKTLNRLK